MNNFSMRFICALLSLGLPMQLYGSIRPSFTKLEPHKQSSYLGLAACVNARLSLTKPEDIETLYNLKVEWEVDEKTNKKIPFYNSIAAFSDPVKDLLSAIFIMRADYHTLDTHAQQDIYLSSAQMHVMKRTLDAHKELDSIHNSLIGSSGNFIKEHLKPKALTAAIAWLSRHMEQVYKLMHWCSEPPKTATLDYIKQVTTTFNIITLLRDVTRGSTSDNKVEQVKIIKPLKDLQTICMSTIGQNPPSQGLDILDNAYRIAHKMFDCLSIEEQQTLTKNTEKLLHDFAVATRPYTLHSRVTDMLTYTLEQLEDRLKDTEPYASMSPEKRRQGIRRHRDMLPFILLNDSATIAPHALFHALQYTFVKELDEKGAPVVHQGFYIPVKMIYYDETLAKEHLLHAYKPYTGSSVYKDEPWTEYAGIVLVANEHDVMYHACILKGWDGAVAHKLYNLSQEGFTAIEDMLKSPWGETVREEYRTHQELREQGERQLSAFQGLGIVRDGTTPDGKELRIIFCEIQDQKRPYLEALLSKKSAVFSSIDS